MPYRLFRRWTAALAVGMGLAFTGVADTATREGSDTNPEPDPHVLSRIESRSDSLRALGELPIVILDIDGTLFDPAARHRAIFLRYATENPRLAETIRPAVESLPYEDYAYAPESTLARMGITDPELVEAMKKHWVEHFFTNEFLLDDLPISGGAEYVEALWDQGVFIAYLTGRDVPRMLEGTVASLRKDGYPVSRPRISVILKPDPKMKDFDFKGPVLDELDGMGTVIAVFENEPKNLNLMADRFPEAEAVFLDTNHSPREIPVRARASWIRSYDSR